MELHLYHLIKPHDNPASISQMRKKRPRKVERFAQGHTAVSVTRWQESRCVCLWSCALFRSFSSNKVLEQEPLTASTKAQLRLGGKHDTEPRVSSITVLTLGQLSSAPLWQTQEVQTEMLPDWKQNKLPGTLGWIRTAVKALGPCLTGRQTVREQKSNPASERKE